MFEAEESKKTRNFRKPLLTFVCFAILAAVGVGGWYYLSDTNRPDLIQASVRQQVDFPLYYPSRLPDGYSVSQAPSVSESVVAMAVRTPSGNTIYISQQAAPSGFDYQKFLQNELKRPQEVSTPIGVGYIGGPVGRILGSILTSKTWILANTNLSGNTESEIKEVLKSLSLAK